MAKTFKISSEHKPTGDQPEAIRKLTESLKQGKSFQTLLGVTGSGKTFTMANVIQNIGRPALILAPNKTLAAQLYQEFKSLFPENSVEFFVSYYDYYQPEAYLPSTDTFIEKDSAINDQIDKLRHAATYALLERDDVIIVSSVSCIYGLGSPEAYEGSLIFLEKGMQMLRDELLRRLVEIQYERNDIDFHRGTFRVRGDSVDIYPSYMEDRAIRAQFFGDELESLAEIDSLSGKVIEKISKVPIYPGSHYVVNKDIKTRAMETIRLELRERLTNLKSIGKHLEYQRIEQRTLYDLEMIESLGYCQGIENYSRHLTGRKPGEPPPTLLDYFPKDFLLFVDESHITIPQFGGMYRGDRSRKETLVEHGFRLPSALDNRPLNFTEFETFMRNTIFVSATPADYELQKSQGEIVEQLIRPTGLTDPIIEIKPATDQVKDCYQEIKKCIEKGNRVLITTLTKRFSEDLSKYYTDVGLKVKYLHSDIVTLERLEILRDLRLGTFDVLIGINLLREGLDIPEVSLVAIMDADKEGFLRSERSLIQTIGRAARNSEGRVILYADRITGSMEKAISETNRRRDIQLEHNKKFGITPITIKKAIADTVQARGDLKEFKFVPDEVANHLAQEMSVAEKLVHDGIKDPAQIDQEIKRLKKEMLEAAKTLQFETAGRLRDEIRRLENIRLVL